MITWWPIGDIPDELKDGRDVLVWEDGFSAVVAGWGEYWHEGKEVSGWLMHNGANTAAVSHYAEINPPGVQGAYVRDCEHPERPPLFHRR